MDSWFYTSFAFRQTWTCVGEGIFFGGGGGSEATHSYANYFHFVKKNEITWVSLAQIFACLIEFLDILLFNLLDKFSLIFMLVWFFFSYFSNEGDCSLGWQPGIYPNFDFWLSWGGVHLPPCPPPQCVYSYAARQSPDRTVKEKWHQARAGLKNFIWISREHKLAWRGGGLPGI